LHPTKAEYTRQKQYGQYVIIREKGVLKVRKDNEQKDLSWLWLR